MNTKRLVFLAGPNGAGKTTYYRTFLSRSGLLFINADEITLKLAVANEAAARFADAVREALVSAGEPFITETVFSDPVGAKLEFLRKAAAAGYDVQIHYIGISSAALSEARVAQRVRHGGHDVPSDRLERRWRQSLRNLGDAIPIAGDVRVYDNSDPSYPYRLVARFQKGQSVFLASPVPDWLGFLAGEG